MQQFNLFRLSVLWGQRAQASKSLLPDWAELCIPIPHAEMDLENFWTFQEPAGKLE